MSKKHKGRQRDLIAFAADLGYSLDRMTTQGHLKFIHPKIKGGVICAPHSDDPRATKNMRSELQRRVREVESKNLYKSLSPVIGGLTYDYCQQEAIS